MNTAPPLPSTSSQVRQRRVELGLRREDVAAHAGVSVATVIRAETGHSVNTANLQRIADALQADWLLLRR